MIMAWHQLMLNKERKNQNKNLWQQDGLPSVPFAFETNSALVQKRRHLLGKFHCVLLTVVSLTPRKRIKKYTKISVESQRKNVLLSISKRIARKSIYEKWEDHNNPISSSEGKEQSNNASPHLQVLPPKMPENIHQIPDAFDERCSPKKAKFLEDQENNKYQTLIFVEEQYASFCKLSTYWIACLVFFRQRNYSGTISWRCIQLRKTFVTKRQRTVPLTCLPLQ